MKMGKTLKYVNETKLLERRFGLIAVARHRNKSRMRRAIEIQDKLRGKSKEWDSTKAIRKWRDKRYGPSGP